MEHAAKYPDLLGSVAALTTALDIRDSYTKSHCDRVVALSVALGKACGLAQAELDHLRIGSRFHDIGKIGIADSVLLKPGRLNAEEWAAVKAHSEFGERIFRATGIDTVEPIARAIRHHHESFDGRGYPDGLAGEAIPLLSRVMLVVDAYEAMTTARPYQAARSHRQVRAIIESESGTKLDPEVVRVFFAQIETSPYRAN